MSRPIPSRLLIHNAVLKHKTGIDRNRNAVYEESLLEHVRVEPTLAISRGNAGETKADTMTLFIDSVNSVYVLPSELDCVRWNGRDFTVRSIKPCYAKNGNTPHHWEVALE